jgi:membrane-bound serine protease (ClpP class)
MPELQLGWPFILATMLTLAGLVAFLARLAVRAQRRRSVTGAAGMLGASGEVIDPIDSGGIGRVTTHGEIWSAVAGQPISRGTRIRVVGISGLTLTVSPDPVSGPGREGAS